MSVTETSSEKPTVVLVHGAFAESSSWNGEISGLLAEGYPAIAASPATPYASAVLAEGMTVSGQNPARMHQEGE